MTIKTNDMNNIVKIFFAAIITVSVSACGNTSKEKNNSLAEMKTRLEKLKTDKNKLDEEIRQLEEEIAKVDSNAASVAKLVSVDTVETQDFSHYIELQGKIDADNIVYVTPRGTPSQVKALYVKRGDFVKQGQLLAKLDDAIMLQQLETLKTQLSYAEDLYNRQKNLWDQGIGTEVAVVNAKNSVDNSKKQIATLTETWNTSFVYAPISGIVNEVNVKVGEIFTGITGNNIPQIQIINNNSLKMVTEVPENYIARVKKGGVVQVEVPEIGKPAFKSVISVVGASIDPTKRSFVTEAKLPSDPLLKPNQLATMKILDYEAKNAIVVPINVVQTDEKGKYVYVMEKSGDKMIAKKKPVNVGEAYNGQIEIKNGLDHNQVIITEGYQTVYDGQTITTGI
jgi:membrane fusion protein, multidrug efflux system